MTKWISQFTLSKLTKIQTDYIKEIHVISLTSLKFLSTFSALKTQLPLFHTISSTLHTVSLSHNLFTINHLSRLGFSFRGRLCFSFCFMGFFWVGSNNYVLKIVILLGNFLLICDFLEVITCYLWVGFGFNCFFSLNFKVSKYCS